ncbi:MAG: bifunctional diguanylate cyclase/phosphodiesterase [Lachnospiraceae bacterium]|nr:bifunctional diguanylate cyclase/phosphodiesterase [Lachnospiraceae bacterium]
MTEKIIFPDREVLQKMRQIFDETLSIYSYCYGRPFEPLLVPSATDDILALLDKAVSEDERQLLVASFSDHPIENIIMGESVLPWVQIRGVSIRDRLERCVAVWVFVAFCEDKLSHEDRRRLPQNLRLSTEAEFEKAIPLVEQLNHMYFSIYNEGNELYDRLQELTQVNEWFQSEKRRNEVLNQILDLLESDQDFSIIMDNILSVAGNYVQVSDASLLRMHQTTGKVDMICEWKRDEAASPLMESWMDLDPKELPFFDDKPYTLSSNTSLPKDFRDFFQKHGISAGIFLPLEIDEKVVMYACFLMLGERKLWTVDELHFFNSVKRVMQSILTRRTTRNSLATSYTALDQILDNNGCGLCVMVPGEEDYLFSNELFGQMLSDPRDEHDFKKTILSQGDDVTEISEYFAQTSKRCFHVQLAFIHWVDGRTVRLSTLFEITDAKMRLEQMRIATYTDYLTGLYNRQRFESDFDTLLQDALRADECGSFLYLNLDDFKDINGGPGFRAGDKMLVGVAKALLSICRPKATCYRIGGDEFGILIPFSEQQQVKRLIETIQHRFEQPWKINGEKYHCTMSLGVVKFPQDGDDVGELIQRAHLALSLAKQNGRGQAEYYSGEDAELSAKRLMMENAMRRAVEEGCGEFEVYYQPLISATDPERKCIGAEALVRWNSRVLGFVQPDEFISMAEYLGLIIPIGRHVLYEACRHCKRWNDLGNPEFTISVNLSVVQLMQNDIVKVIQQMLRETKMNPVNLILEITESVAIHDMQKVKTTLEAIRAMGISIALDDFGTGYSSLSRLKDLPLDEIKIDKSFVDHIAEDDFSEALVETVTSLTDTMKVNVVVEGVEQEKQAKELDTMNVHMFQGYLFDKPLTHDAFEKKYMK